MADLQVTIPYKTVPARATFVAMCTLLPVWAIAAPAALGFFVGYTLSNHLAFPLAITAAVYLGLLSITILCVMITAVAEDNRIHISKDGLAFPLFLLPTLQFRRQRSWLELRQADLMLSGSDQAPWVVLTFNNGKCLRLKLPRMSPRDVEQLFMGVELWATGCRRSSPFIEYQRHLQNEGRELGQTGYTQMWEEELSRRFSATSFIPLEPGQKLLSGKLEVVRQLAFGGLSAIYLAQENRLETVVLKEAVVPANADSQARSQAEEHLLREAEMLSRLQHPNVARVLDHFVEEGRHYLKLEYINGQDLRQYIKQNGCLPPATAVEWGLQIAAILQFLHSQIPPIIHRDLTPDNLVLTNSGQIILIDFGAANMFVGAATGTIVGKQAYIPAEQLRGKAVLASDIYAFGGTLHYLLTGKDPVPLSVSHPAQFQSEIGEGLDNVVARCTAFEAQDRYQSGEELAAALASLSASDTPRVIAT